MSRLRTSLGLHLTLALLFPLVWRGLFEMGGDILGVGLAAVASVPYLLAPLLSYVSALTVSSTELPETEPPQESGQVFGWSWFGFASRPGVRMWVRDSALVSSVRERPILLRVDGLSGELESSRSLRPIDHVAAGRRAVQETLLGMLAGSVVFCIILYIGFLFGTPISSTAVLMGLFGVVGGVFVGLLPSVWGFLTLFSFVFGLCYFGWNVLLRPSDAKDIRLTGTLLSSSRGRVDLDHPDLQVELLYDPFGARLVVSNPGQRVVLSGRHADLAPIAKALQQTEVSSTTERVNVASFLERVRSSA